MTTMDEYLKDLMSKTQDFDTTERSIKALIYGDSGVGKTVAGVALALAITQKDKKVFYIDSGQGGVSISNHTELDTSRLIRAEFTSLPQLNALSSAILNNYKGMGKIGAIVLDEASTMSSMDLDGITLDRAGKDLSKDPDTPTQPDFNTATNRMRKIVSEFVRLPTTHLIMLSHVRKDKDSRGVEVTGPDFLPKLSKRMRELMHLVAHMQADLIESEEGKSNYRRTFQVHPSRLTVAKTRIDGLNTQVTFKQLVARLREWTDSEEKLISTAEPEIDLAPLVPTETEATDTEEFTGIEVSE